MGKALQPRKAVQSMAVYAPPTGGRSGKLRLDFNENTVGCSPRVTAFLREKLKSESESVAIYPEYKAAHAELAAHFGVAESELLLTNGTDEAIQILINTYVDAGDEVIILQPSYAMYRFYAELAGAVIRDLSYRAGTLAFPLEELLLMISERTRAVLISNPNNPTGTAIPLDGVKRIAERASSSAILIDEAYYEFCGLTALPLLARYPNLFVSRTFSKAHGMAGLRLGCLFSDERNLAFVHKAQSPYGVNMLAALAARAAIADPDYLKQYVAEILAARESLCAGLTKIGIPFHKSAGNFILIQCGNRAAQVKDKLAASGILVRDRSHELAGAVRVTVGTEAQVDRFLGELEHIWREG
jgi:histidinol-phosphate aminotransferase